LTGMWLKTTLAGPVAVIYERLRGNRFAPLITLALLQMFPVLPIEERGDDPRKKRI
jgi:hypothetical protein